MQGAGVIDERFFQVTVDHDARVYVAQRTEIPFATLEELDQTMVLIEKSMDRFGRVGWKLIIDLRLVKGRNDEPFEAAMRRHRPRLQRGLDRVGLMVRSVIGELQILRHIREDGCPVAVSSNAQLLLEELGLKSAPAGFFVDSGPSSNAES